MSIIARISVLLLGGMEVLGYICALRYNNIFIVVTVVVWKTAVTRKVCSSYL